MDELYKASNVPSEDWVRLPKDVLLVVPEKGRDVKPVLARLGLSKHEVAVTWPKEGLDMAAEWEELAPKVTIQLDQAVLTDDCEDFPVLPVEGFEPSPELEARVRLAMADAYVGLHHHDEFSIKDGLGTVEQLVKLLKAQRRSFCCVTNHGSVGGWIKQYNACKKAGVKAIFGMEAYVSDYRGDDPELKKAHRSANHLVLIARTKEGFDNIVRIHNDAQMHGFYYTPRVNREAIARWGKGIVGSSACMAGELPRALMEGDKEKAMEVWEFYSKAFDRFYVEIQVIEYEPQREANRRLIEFAREVGAPMLLTCDSHYLEAEHSETHDLLMCMRQGKTVLDKMDDQSDVWNFDVKNMYCRNADQMWEVFAGGFVDASGERPPFMDDVFTQEVYLEACENTRLLAGETEEIKLDSSIKLPKLYADGKKEMTRKVNAGFTRRWAEKKDRDEREGRAKSKEEYLELQKEYVARIRHEFGVITKLGWTDYFLVMERIISETIAKHGEWAIGYGRGSAAGSLISYCLGLTDVDPMEWGLMFERFLDEGRPDPPDIDTDFDPRVRDWVKQHIVKTFGADNVCSIGTYTTYRTRAVILDLARVLALDLGEASVVTKGIDPLRSFEDDEGEDTKVDKLSFDELESHYPELKAYFLEHPEVRRHAEVLRNQVKNMGMHAGGVIISDGSLKDKIPVLYDKPSNEERQVISAWAESGNASELSAVGLVKYDILGLNNLPVIADCCSLVKKHWPSEASRVQRRNIPINDSEAIKNGSQDDLVGIFQLESPATRPVAKQVGMESLEDVSAVTSLLRPGPKDMGMDKEYAERKHGKPYEMPAFLRELWKDTYGVLTYQEQAMKVSQALCGFTGPESNKLRKAIGKKLKDLMAEMKEKFIKGAQKRVDAGDITADEVLVVWNQVESFAGYGFNKSVDVDSVVWCNGVQKKVGDVVVGDRVLCFDGKGLVETEVVANHDHGVLPAFEVEFDGGKKVVCSILHKFETPSGKVPLWKLMFGGEVLCAEEDERLGMFFLPGGVSDEKDVGEAQVGESVSSDSGFVGAGGLPGMRKDFPERGSVPEASSDVSGGDGRCKGKQVAEGHGEHASGSCCRGRNDGRGKVGEGKSGVCCGVGDAGGNCGTEGDAGEVESYCGVQDKGFGDGDEDFNEDRAVGEEGEELAVVGRISSGGAFGELVEGKASCKELESGRVGVEMVVVGNGIQAEGAGSMRFDCEGSGFRERGCVGGGGRMLALRGGFRQEEVSLVEGSREGCGAQLGGGASRDNADSARRGLLEGKRKVQVEAGVVGFVEGTTETDAAGSVSVRRVLSARLVGFRRMCDLEVSHSVHNFILANGVVTSNSHAITYSAISTVELWLKYRYPAEFMTALINNTKLGKKKHGSEDVMVDYIKYARRTLSKIGVEVVGPDVNKSDEDFTIEPSASGRNIRFSIGHVKNVATSSGVVMANRPYASVQDFYDRVKTESTGSTGKKTVRRVNKKVVESLVAAGAFDSLVAGSTVAERRNAAMAEYYKARKEKEPAPERSEDEWEEAEKEAIGLCLSIPPIYKKYEAMVLKEKWDKLSDLEEKRVMAFGRIEKIVPTNSKSGNPRFDVTISDGIDSLRFMVFMSSMQYFRDTFKVGYVVAMPLSKFDEGNTRFFDDRGKAVVVDKGRKVEAK